MKLCKCHINKIVFFYCLTIKNDIEQPKQQSMSAYEKEENCRHSNRMDTHPMVSFQDTSLNYSVKLNFCRCFPHTQNPSGVK